jgi:NDP-sugar pyrophosphorylase family protein
MVAAVSDADRNPAIIEHKRDTGLDRRATDTRASRTSGVPGLSGSILAAGRGERLRATSGGVPKPLVELGGEVLLLRQARALAALGACPVHAIINSETAAIIRDRELPLPPELEICVRDTANSMESLLALGKRLAPGRFLMTTVDAVIPPPALAGFLKRALELTDPARPDALDGALGVVAWRGDKRPLFAEVASDGVIRRLRGNETRLVTAGVYLLPTRVFAFGEKARSAGLDALRRYLALLIDEGLRFAGIEIADAIDIDDAADMDAARALVAGHGGRS